VCDIGSIRTKKGKKKRLLATAQGVMEPLGFKI